MGIIDMPDPKEREDHDGTKDTYYPDLGPPEGEMEGMKKIIRHPRMQQRAPKINWGSTYNAWEVKKRLRYAEELANSMNHAADILQQERNKLLKICQAQENQLKQYGEKYEAQGGLMSRELADADKEKQELYQQIVDLGKQIKQRDRTIAKLEKKIEEMKKR